MESLMHYSNPSHALSVLGLLNEQRLRGQMCDVILVVADQKYNAHKSVLAASSEYFQSVFNRMDTESSKVINLDFCEPDAFEIVLNYIYSSSLFVDNGSLAAIQELGYSLGIPFLTNIASARPHASYSVSRKRFSFSEGDENDVQARSVIVRRVKTDSAHPSYSNYSNNLSEKAPSSHSARETPHPSVQNFKSIRSSESIKSSPLPDTSEQKSIHPYASILKGNPSHITSVRPQLTSSVSFSDAEVHHIRLQPDQDTKDDIGEYDSHYRTKVPLQGTAQEPSQTIDRSGPLIKSLLRRSLSMDSPVPVFSPTLELRDLQNREQSVVKMVSRVSGSETPIHNGGSKRTSPLVLRSRCPGGYDTETQVESEISVKAEPSSPLADPMEIVRITVGDALPVSLKDFQTNFEQSTRTDHNFYVKRKDRPDNRRYPFKKSKFFKEQGLRSEENISEIIPQSASELDESSDKPHPGKTFKCWNCLKVFRSSAGLHRHVNMYHNPEKPYVCDICHKRFHTNFKVWTHCQTQHGVMQNPASSSSSVLDEKFQKKLIDIVREREIKKALLWKLKRNKQGLQSSVHGKKKSRTNFICPYCGKVYVFQSQYRQHIKTHLFSHQRTERTVRETQVGMQGEELPQENSADSGVYFCRLCNVKLSSLFEQGDHERGCRHATVCPYCGLRFSSPVVKKDHEAHCKYKKLTCLECMRTFKSSFSIWRHQVEVHNHNMMSAKDQLQLTHQENHQEGISEEIFREEQYSGVPLHTGNVSEDMGYSNSSGQPIYDSEDSLSYVPEDLSMSHHGKLVVKEEPIEEDVTEMDNTDTNKVGPEEPGVWPCEKCGNLFSSRKDLERHQELLCHIKPFICHICNKAFRTNFRLWSHFQSHMSASESGAKEIERQPSPLSPSPPLTPQNSERPPTQASVVKSTQSVPVAASVSEESGSPEPSGSVSKNRRTEFELPPTSPSSSPISRANSLENPAGPQEPDTLFYHAPSLSALTFKRQYMCKLCHRTFKTAFSLWSHEQSHSHV